MSPKLPQVSGEQLVKVLEKMGYEVIRQKGSHIRLRKFFPGGEHKVTVPNHKVISKGTLNDILSSVSLRIGISKEDLLEKL